MKPSVEMVPIPAAPSAAGPAAAPPVFGAPTSQKPGAKTTSPSFLNAATSTPSKANVGSKTLVGT